ncbi:ABC transporter permease [Alkalihalobacillus trypoxylicola]|uniref:Cell division protein FtsX n=1 Tax=Alkalihalobacillus trypoxylicola TaxID=519424 RepID=A0A161PBZ9_9BACI|nr:ABC transporter permease [Alkalihalobacillus trypoxylicola]KYG29359.1 cell division protein FtsX [Alkalihalobacillus trypoxylicola]
MNIVNKVTLRHLKENKKRTLITIVGTIISVAMVVAVATLGSSFLNMLQRDTIKTFGEWHVMYNELNQEQIESIHNEANTKSLSLIRDIGYAYLEQPTDENKPYLYINELNLSAFEQMQVQLLEGRLPQNNSEVVISEEMLNGSEKLIEVGDTLELEIGARSAKYDDFFINKGENSSLYTIDGENKEFLIELEKKEYSVVGIIEEPLWDHYWSSGYSIISLLNEQSPLSSADYFGYVTLDKVKRTVFEEGERFAKEHQIENVDFNHELLRYQGITINDNVQATMYGLLSIIMVVIMIGSISLIFNSFAISVSERSRYLGMLSSVGATKRQKRNSVYFEGFIIGAISIPIGIIAGITGIGVTLIFVNSLLGSIGYDQEMSLVISPVSILISVLISTLTIFISTYIPAKRASKITAIDAIRQSHDIKLSKKTVKTSSFIKNFFGIEAEIALKNIKRNKKRYYVTVFSLMTSIILFLTVSYFSYSLSKSMELSQETVNFDISISSHNSGGQLDELLSKLDQVEGITAESLNQMIYLTTNVEKEYLPDSLLQSIEEVPEELVNGKYSYGVDLVSMNQNMFEQYVTSIGLDVEDFDQTNQHQAILVNQIQYENAEQGKYVEGESIKLQEGDTLQLELTTYSEEIDDMVVDEYGEVEIGALTNELPLGNFYSNLGSIILIVSPAAFEGIVDQMEYVNHTLYIQSNDPIATQEQLELMDNIDFMNITNTYMQRQADENLLKIMSIFMYGFITLITLISVANIFNTISTSIALRKREFAMLKSMGMTPKAFNKMIRFESLFFGMKAILYGLPISVIIMYLIYMSNQYAFSYTFTLPWIEIMIVMVSVFMIVGLAMLYSISKVKKENIIDVLKQENI